MSAEINITANYIKYVLSKIESDLYNHVYPVDITKTVIFLNYIKASQSLLRDIYIITNVDNLEPFGKYLLFMMKKAETGQINFENLIQNMEKDKSILIHILIRSFKSKNPASVRKNWKEIHEEVKTSLAKASERKKKEKARVSPEIENKFKIEEFDNELVTEEFIDKNIEEIEASQKIRSEEEPGNEKRSYLELIKNETKEENKKVFNLPGQEPEGESEEEVELTEEDIDTVIKPEAREPQKSKEHKKPKERKRKIAEPENAAFGFDDLKKEIAERIIPEKEKPAEKIIPEEEKTTTDKTLEKNAETKTPETKSGKENIQTEQESKETVEQLSFIDSPPEESDERRDEYTVEEKELSKEAEVQVNTIYQEYESELITRNALLITDLDELALLIPEENSEDRKIALTDNIIENTSFMEESSSNMSFEIITNIYGIMKLAFGEYKVQEFIISKENIDVFKISIHLIESLIKGDSYEDYDKVIKETEKIKSEITEKKKEKENFEKMQKDKLELEKHLSLKYTDTTQREKLALLKQYILELEKIFNSLDDIKSEFQIYEALRKLSATFVRFKEMVNISRILNISKLAQLSEASYIFVKFLQNYRLDPYDEDVREIFRFIIYNFKLIFLDKPTKDLALFISILNDPVKVFSKSKKKKNE
ncbi:MAG TPA: hypothetical protein VIK14_11045 [Ignavibacteria bacterium]